MNTLRCFFSSNNYGNLTNASKTLRLFINECLMIIFAKKIKINAMRSWIK
jgi:hypothetical protein